MRLGTYDSAEGFVRLAVDDFFQVLAKRLTRIGMIEAVGDCRLEVAEFTATVVSNSVERVGMYRRLLKEIGDGIGQLYFTAGATPCFFELVKDLCSKQVTSDDCQV